LLCASAEIPMMFSIFGSLLLFKDPFYTRYRRGEKRGLALGYTII